MTQERCPTCKQPIPIKAHRLCYDCGQPIVLHHKWTWQEREGILTCVHRHCSNPDSYQPKEI